MILSLLLKDIKSVDSSHVTSLMSFCVFLYNYIFRDILRRVPRTDGNYLPTWGYNILIFFFNLHRSRSLICIETVVVEDTKEVGTESCLNVDLPKPISKSTSVW